MHTSVTSERKEVDSRFKVKELEAKYVPQTADVHANAFAGTLGVKLGNGYRNAFINWFVQYNDAVKLVCLEGETVAGYVFGAPAGYGKALNKDMFWRNLLSFLTHPQVIFHPNFLIQIQSRLTALLGSSKKAASSKKEIAGPNESFFSLVGIGTNINYQRLGVASQLVTAFADQVHAMGYKTLRLSVYSDNVAAISFYEKNGWYRQEQKDLNQHETAQLVYYYLDLPSK